MELTFGIDLGTSRSCICTIIKQNPEMIPVGNSNLLPSFVSFKNGTCKVGDAAKQEFVGNSGNVVYNTKRLIGRKFSDKEVQEDIRNLHYNIKEGMDGGVLIELLEGELKTPVEIATLIMLELKKFAEQFAEKSGRNVVKKVVVCVPAYFSDKQRKDTESAAKNAEFEVLSLINEPTAAAIAYSYDKRDLERPTKMMVYDLGGGTFDVSIIEVFQGNISVIGSFGDSHLGGEDFTNALVEYMKEKIEEEEDRVIRKPKELAKLQKACEEAKIMLSDSKEYVLTFNDNDYTISREKYSGLIKDLLNRTIDIVNQTLGKHKVKENDIEVIILIGGGSKMPQIPDYIKRQFPKSEISKAINADEAVSQGAARYANDLMNERSIVVRNRDTGKISIKSSGDQIAENEEVKMDYSQRTGDLQSSVVLNKVTNELELLDLRNSSTPESNVDVIIPPVSSIPKIIDKVNHSYGVEVQNSANAPKKMYFMIKSGSDLPARRDKLFETIEDNQEYISIKIFEGENEFTEYDNFLKEIKFGPFEKMRRGEYKFMIIFEVDKNGYLSVKATHNDIELGVVQIFINH